MVIKVLLWVAEVAMIGCLVAQIVLDIYVWKKTYKRK